MILKSTSDYWDAKLRLDEIHHPHMLLTSKVRKEKKELEQAIKQYEKNDTRERTD